MLTPTFETLNTLIYNDRVDALSTGLRFTYASMHYIVLIKLISTSIAPDMVREMWVHILQAWPTFSHCLSYLVTSMEKLSCVGSNQLG